MEAVGKYLTRATDEVQFGMQEENKSIWIFLVKVQMYIVVWNRIGIAHQRKRHNNFSRYCRIGGIRDIFF